MRRRSTSSYSRVHACPSVRLGLSRSSNGRRSCDRPQSMIGNSPCRGSAPTVARDLSSPDHAPARAPYSLVVNVPPSCRESCLLGPRTSGSYLADDGPHETCKLTCDRSHRDGLELASPDQLPVATVEAALRLPGDLANRSRCRGYLLLLVFAHPRRMLIAPRALHQRAARASLPALVMGPRLIVSPVESSDGTRPRYPISSQGD